MVKRRAGDDRGLQDHVDVLVHEWSQSQPDLEVWPLAIVYRLTRLAAHWSAEIERYFAPFGMTTTDFAVLANLRRVGEPYELTQRQLMTSLRLTAGTVSLRVDKLVERGFVRRQADPSDARAVRVTLTDAGLQAFDQVAPGHLANEARLVAGLNPDEQQRMAELLRTLLIDVEQPQANRPDERLGLRLLSSAAGWERRAAVGLPPHPGLLVESIVAGAPAADAGIRVGDLVTRVDGHPVNSLASLEAALIPAPSHRVEIHREGRNLRVAVADQLR